MLTLQVPAWNIALRSALIYLVVLAGLRLAGKREIGQLTVFDFVLLLLVSNAVQNAMVGPDTSLTGGLIAAGVLIAVNMVLARLRLRSQRLRRLVEGSPTLLVLDGEVLSANLRREGLDEDVLEAALREHGVASPSDVEMAVLETDGSISVVPMGETHKRIRRPLKYTRPH